MRRRPRFATLDQASRSHDSEGTPAIETESCSIVPDLARSGQGIAIAGKAWSSLNRGLPWSRRTRASIFARGSIRLCHSPTRQAPSLQRSNDGDSIPRRNRFVEHGAAQTVHARVTTGERNTIGICRKSSNETIHPTKTAELLLSTEKRPSEAKPPKHERG